MSYDAAIRTAAVVAAAALLAAPYRDQLAGWLSAAAKAAKARGPVIARVAAACLLLAAGWGKIPLPQLPAAAPAVTVETPSAEMQTLVQPVADALSGASAVDRALWAEIWSKAATVAAGDAVTTEVVFSDTRSLRAFTALAVDIGWRRIGGHVPGSNESLRRAVEAAYATALGKDVVPVTADVRARYVAFCKAVAWAGVGKG